MRTVLGPLGALLVVGALATAAACGSGSEASGSAASGEPAVVVTTSILGDVVANLVGDAAEVDVIMPPGTDPHEFAPSARQVAAMRQAEVLVVNGLGFEAGLHDAIEAAKGDGTAVITATDAIDPLGADPHFFTDPVRMADAAASVADQLAAHVDGLDTPAFRQRVDRYLGELHELDGDLAAILAPVPSERRVLVTNHEVFGYFADRYDFTVLGTVIPGGSTLAGPSAGDLHRLADAIATAGVPAVFAETSSPTRLVEALAAEGAGHVQVVPLYSESLGPPDSDGATYLDLMRTNAHRIAAALAISG